MAIIAHRERRREKTRAFRLARPAFITVPAKIAAPALTIMAIALFVIDFLTSAEISFAPVYLVICASAAWLVGLRFATALALGVLVVQILIGNVTEASLGLDMFAFNYALRIGSVLAILLMLGMARASLEKEWLLARTDPLTGALNRQAFFEAMKSTPNGVGLAILAFADADGLKRVNDELGHEQGDACLRDFAQRIRSAIRKEDIFARLGGDEFAIFMNVRDHAAARNVADRLNSVLNAASDADGASLKGSLGILLMPKGSQSIDAELNLADKLMYSAKRERAGLMMALAVDHQETQQAWSGNPESSTRAKPRAASYEIVPTEEDLAKKLVA